MSNLFLKVNKDLFKLGLNPTEILILAQILEFQTKGLDCFISDETLAENLGVSKSTITRTVKGLDEKGYIKRETKNTQKGKDRRLTVLIDKIENSSNSQNDTSAKVKMTIAEQSNCSLRKEQNDTIKDNRKDNIKDKEKTVEPIQPTVEVVSIKPPEVNNVIKLVRSSTNADGAFSF